LRTKKTDPRIHGKVNPWGHYRKPQHIPTANLAGDNVLTEFLNSTATFVSEVFPPLELEIHRAMTVARAHPDWKCDQLQKTFPDGPISTLGNTDTWKSICQQGKSAKQIATDALSNLLDLPDPTVKRYSRIGTKKISCRS
jgi:hypothetical protein